MLEKLREISKAPNADQMMEWCQKTHPDLWTEFNSKLGTSLEPMLVGIILTAYYYEVVRTV